MSNSPHHFQWLTEDQSRELTPELQEAVVREVADVQFYLAKWWRPLIQDCQVQAKICSSRCFRYCQSGRTAFNSS